MIRYSKLAIVELNVSDLEVSLPFYRDMVGLELSHRTPSSAYFRCDASRHSVVLRQSDRPGFRRASWSLEDDTQFEDLHRSLTAHGVAYEELGAEELAERGFGRGSRMVEPHTGATLEFFILPPDTPDYVFTPTHTKIQRLGHVVWSTPEKDQSVAFFRDVLNFKESDSLGEATTFMRPFPSPYHHGIGVATSAHRRFHHLNFMVSEIDDVGKAFNRFRRNDVKVAFGPGRHPVSTSIFLYYFDPDGLTLEYSFGMEEFPEVDARDPRVMPQAPESIDAWGSPRAQGFASTGEIERIDLASQAS